ncbi:MAG: hypothetical protein JWO19_5947, partial [Bryobacterales bacterium]|nr:hypothetical protein [Bryobacterales bacterium]
ITAEKAVLEAKVAELGEHIDVLIAMAESVANNALNMLKATRLKGTPAAVIPYAPKTAIERLQAAGVVNGHATDNAMNAAQNAGALSLGLGDIVNRVKRAPINDDMLNTGPARWPAAIDAPLIPAPPSLPEPAAPSIAESPTSAIDRIKRHFLPAVTLMRRPVDPPIRVSPDPAGLPMFLRRDTVFARIADAA